MFSSAWIVGNAIVFLAWIACMISWVRSGCPIPRRLHYFAAFMFLAGATAFGVMTFAGMFSVSLMLSCLIIPPGAACIGWLWLFGP